MLALMKITLNATTIMYQMKSFDLKKLMLRIRFSHSRRAYGSRGGREGGIAKGREDVGRASGQVVIKCAQKTLSATQGGTNKILI